MTAAVADRPVDLRRDSLSVVRAIDFRNPLRDYWADEAAVHAGSDRHRRDAMMTTTRQARRAASAPWEDQR